MLRALVQPLSSRVSEEQLRRLVQWRNGEAGPIAAANALVRRAGPSPSTDGACSPADYVTTPATVTGARARLVSSFDAQLARRETTALIRDALERHHVPYVALPAARGEIRLLAVSADLRADAMTALTADLTGPEWLVTNRRIGELGARTAAQRNTRRAHRLAQGAAGPRIWVYRLLAAAGSGEVIGGREQGCQLEFWSRVTRKDIPRADGGSYPVDTRIAPGRNGVVAYLSPENWQRAIDASNHWLPEPDHKPIFEVREPIDIVYTWVDGDDPQWQQRKDAVSGGLQAAEHNSSAAHASRYASRDELRYSLRSVAMYASWVRKIFIVTDQQCPAWLNVSHPQIELIDHKQIFTDPGGLPVFNSHAIESQLHHIPDLSERYLYLNDDFFFGRPVEPELFFEGNGLAHFFLSPNVLDIDPPSSRDLPVMSAAKRNRQVIEDDFGVVIANKFKHTPQPQLRSVLEQMEQRHPELFRRVSHSRFRHPDDVSIPSALSHYYAYALGRAVSAPIRYAYQDIDLPETQRRLDGLIRSRAVDVFCLNDGESDPSRHEAQSAMLRTFFDRYFPLRSDFELPDR